MTCKCIDLMRALTTIAIAVAGLEYIYAQNESSHLFDSDSVLEINLTANFKSLKSKKFKDPEPEYWAKLWYENTHKDTVVIYSKVKARGDVRKKVCIFPPIRLDLPKTKVADTWFQGENKLKMVTHCREQYRNQIYVQKEYLIYKMYSVLSEFSFNARMFRINYFDSLDNQPICSEYAFILEHIDQVAKRNNALAIEQKGIHPRYLEPFEYGVMAMFQYMIGNTDWNEPSMHNLELVKPRDPTSDYLVAVPFDFDYSGLINTYYAIPNEGLAIKSVKERLYRGLCQTPEINKAVLEHFIKHKEAIIEIASQLGDLSDAERNSMVRYLNEFYSHIQDKRGELLYRIFRDCRAQDNYR